VIVAGGEIVERVLVALLSEGHLLLEDVPGVGKTMLARATAVSIGCRFGRIQCTPDLLPSDVVGVSVFDPKSQTFEYRPGPVMTQVLLADEINRATPRTQSALLECMAERQVTVDGTTRPLPTPFLVIATQNPVEYEGTFPLPEAQLDRFFMRTSIGYPDERQEAEILRRLQVRHPLDDLSAVTTPEALVSMQSAVRKVLVEESVRAYVVRIVHGTRSHPDAALGASPRGSLALVRAGQAAASLQGRDYVTPDDIKRHAVSVLAHRVALKPEAELRGQTQERLVRQVVEAAPVQFEATGS